MRNADNGKRLERELGRYRKKTEDQQAVIHRLEEKVKEQEAGARQVNLLVDAVLAAAAVRCGQAVEGDDGEVIGYRLALDNFAVDRMLETWQVEARKQGEGYTIGVVKRETA